MRLDIAAQTDIGRRKKTNEDYFAIFREDTPSLSLFEEGSLLCIADGLGGHTSGDIASKLAVKIFVDILKEVTPANAVVEDPSEEEGFMPLIRSYITQANDALYKTNQDLIKAGKPMGTTLLSAIITPKKVFMGNVGDSRAYHFRDGEIIEKTEDHSWVDEQVKLGLMSKAEAEVDSRKNYVTRSIGTHPEVSVDTYRWHIVPGDWLLLCTDGLVNMVKDPEIRAQFEDKKSAAEIAGNLVDLANDNGGRDNITVVVVHISPSFFRTLLLRYRALVRTQGLKLFWILLTLIFGGACFLGGVILHSMGKIPKF